MLPNSSVVAGSAKPKPDLVVCNSSDLSREPGVGRKETMVGNSEGLIGFLEVYIHQARDIHNICIYHKQDVYAKLCLTSDPETTVSTQIINGGGKNPVFDEVLRLNVQTIDSSSLKCEIWMLSRVRNYLQDQLLGFALVPLSDVLTGNGKLEQEFPLSSNDLFHSPAGFVQLTLTYTGALPEVLEIPTPRSSLTASAAGQDSDRSSSIPNEFDKIEFLDPKIINENEMMVSEYFGIPCADPDPQVSEMGTTENDNRLSSEDVVAHIRESQPTSGLDTIEVPKVEISSSNDLTNGSPSVSVPASSYSVCDTPGASKSTNQDAVSPPKEKMENVGEAESESDSSVAPVSTFAPVISVNVEAEQKLVQQEIVDMYMKSMQQFTESLAKMKLPMDIENGSATSENTDSDEKVQAPKGNSPSPRVFYGSRAFF